MEGNNSMVRRQVLPNGVRIVTEKIDYVQSASIGVWVGVGARDETDDIRGISHVIEHMLFKGTPTRTAPQISDEIDRVGGYLNAFTDKENTCYYAKVLQEHVPVAIDVLSDIFLNSLFDTEELTKEKNVILEEIKRHEDAPDDLIHDLFFETVWPDHNLGKSVIGTNESVSSLVRQNLVDYIAKRYTPDTIVISAAGNLEHDQIVDLISERFSSLSGSRADWRVEDTVPRTVSASKKFSKPIEQVHVVVGVPGYSQMNPDKYKLALLDNILGGGMSSRLFQEIRENRGLAYSVGSYTANYREGGLFAVYAGTSTEAADEVVEIIQDEFKKITADNATAAELDRVKNQIKGGLVMGQESMSGRMMKMGKNELTYDRVIPIEEVSAKIQEVTLEDIHETAKALLIPAKESVVKVGPFDEVA
jgi:predicted Zn-dependent peptidase